MIQLHEIVEEISEVVLFILHEYLFYEMRSSLGKKVNVGHGEAGETSSLGHLHLRTTGDKYIFIYI